MSYPIDTEPTRGQLYSRATIKYQKGHERCPKCKRGLIAYDCQITNRLPIGFGFVGTRFQIDAIERTGHGGDCMDCGAKVFAIAKQKHVVTYPKLNGKR
jgi:hypothetical protein